MSSSPERLFRLFAVVWVGTLLTIGYVVAPTLFAMLDRIAAGAVAARLFRIEAWLGMTCGILSLALGNLLVRRGMPGYRRMRGFVAGMLACVLIGYFALQPFMEAMRSAALLAGTDVGHSEYATRFGVLHGISSLFYLVESLLGVALIWLLPAQAEAGASRR